MANLFFLLLRAALLFYIHIEMHLPVRTILSSHTLRCFSPCVSVVQVRGAKQKFGGLTRDPFRTLKKKLVLEKSHKVSKVPLMSSERRDNIMEFPINRTSAGISTRFKNLPYSG